MDLTSNKSSSYTHTDISHTISLSAKIRRLKIEESFLLQSINKCVPEFPLKDSEIDTTSSPSEFSVFSAKIKDSFRQIHLIFQDIKTSTSSKEILKSIDIDDVKRSTLELENNIKSLKLFLQSELVGLKTAEQQINLSLNENPVIINKLKRYPRVATAKYNEIVPSPVKTLMTSPFKCLEVQQFQEFMMNSANRYGGWNEYHHNIFVNYWQKYFGSEHNDSFEEDKTSVENLSVYPLFMRDLLLKLQDVREQDIVSHVKWYSKYNYLKERQQKAINRWRSNRKIMRSAKVEPEVRNNMNNMKPKSIERKNRHNESNAFSLGENNSMEELILTSPNKNEVCCFVRKCFSDELRNEAADIFSNSHLAQSSNDAGEHKMKKRFQKSTRQWDIRLNSKTIKTDTDFISVENIKKLHTPSWRVGL